MKKKNKERRNQNIVLFPGLKDRLLSIGLEHLDRHQYVEAINLLEQANEMDPENPEIGMAYLIALYEGGDYKNAREQCHKLLNKGIGDYFEIIDVFLMILIQLGEHTEVVYTINALLDENEVPIEKKEHYEKLLHFSEKRVESNNDDQFQTKDDAESAPFIFLDNTITDQILKVAQLANKNIKPYMKQFTNYLSDPSGHPFIQTMVLNVLKEHGIEKEFSINKFQYNEKIIPVNLSNVFETPFYLSFIPYMKSKLENENPTLLDQIKVILDRHFFLLYPYELSPSNPNLWTAAYLSLGLGLYGEAVNLDTIAKQYEVECSALENALSFLHKLEEISLPIL